MQVRFTKRAQRNLHVLLRNIADYYSDEASEKVEAAIYNRLEGLKPFPFQYEGYSSQRFGRVRRIVVLRKTIVLYRVTATEIQVLALYDARTNWK